MLPVLLTVHEVAEQLRVSSAAVYGLIRRGRLRAIHVTPKSVRIREEDLERFVDPAGPELTVAQAAGVLRVSRSEVYLLIREGRLPALKRGRRPTRVLKRDLVNYVSRAADAGPLFR